MNKERRKPEQASQHVTTRGRQKSFAAKDERERTMKHKTRSPYFVIGLLLAAMVLLVGCQPAAPTTEPEGMTESEAEVESEADEAVEPESEDEAEAEPAVDVVLEHSTDYLADPSLAKPIGDEVDTSMYKSDPPWTIAFLKFGSGNSFLVQFEEEVKHEASLFPQIEEFITLSADGDSVTQISQMEDMIARGVDGIILNPVAPDALAPVVEDAAAQGIPVVLVTNRVDTDAYVSLFLADQVKFGRVGGDFLMDQLDCEGKLIVLNGLEGITTNDERRQGLQEAIESCPDGGSNVEILAEEDALWAYDQGKLATERMLAAYPEIDGVWSQGGAMTLGAIDAFEAAGRPLVPMTGEDNNGFMLAWHERIPDGFKAISASEPTWQTRLGLHALLRILQGIEVNDHYELQVRTITEDEVADFVRPEYSDAYWTNSLLPKDVADELYLEE